MSEIRKLILSRIQPALEEQGYIFKKSKNIFTKKVGDYHHNIQFRFDGRGGLVHLDAIDFNISNKENFLFGSSFNVYNEDLYKTIPIFYSKKASELFADVNLKALSQLTFEEKYPPEKINKTIEGIIYVLENRVSPFFENPQ